MALVERLADKMLLMSHGRALAQGTGGNSRQTSAQRFIVSNDAEGLATNGVSTRQSLCPWSTPISA